MDNLDIDFNKLFPDIIDAFTSVYGEEYREIISKKINNAVIIPYYDIEGLDDYISFIKKCKRNEYGIKFLEKIGVDVKKYVKLNYTEPLDDEVEKILSFYMESSYFGFSKNTDFWVPLQAFKESNNRNPKKNLENKIKIINYLLDDEDKKITEEDFEQFVKTEEYNKILKKINKFNVVYEELLLEYRKWEEKLKPYEEFIEFEYQKKDAILKRKKIAAFMDIFPKLPIPIITAIFTRALENKENAILNVVNIVLSNMIEAFSIDNMEKLKSKDVDFYNKRLIIFSQSCYLKWLGIEIPKEQILECNSEENINKYLIFLNQNNIRKYIPSDDLISYLTLIRKNIEEDALKEYYTTRKDYINLKEKFGNDENNLNFIYEYIKRKMICIPSCGATRSDNEFVSLMFYTIRTNCGGRLLFNFVHECGHIIDQSLRGIGFEAIDDFDLNLAKNPYDNSFRKYEKFNEIINDIFTIEVIELLHNQGIYLIEPFEFTKLDTSDFNTSAIAKKLLYSLLTKFRPQIISAKVNADCKELTRYIGEDNFEELNDIVNKVDYLVRNGLASKLDTSQEDDMVKEYYKELERLEILYSKIDDYYRNNFGGVLSSSYTYVRKYR